MAAFPNLNRDPNLLEIAKICENVHTALVYAKSMNLIVDIVIQPQNIPCSLTAGCMGILQEKVIRGRPNIRCNKCKKYRSAFNAPNVFGMQAVQHSWLVNVDRFGHPQHKLPLNVCFSIYKYSSLET